MSNSPPLEDYMFRCNCKASCKAEEAVTCERHHVIFKRKCGHSSTTAEFPFNPDIDCIDCLGKSTYQAIATGQESYIDAVERYARRDEAKRYSDTRIQDGLAGISREQMGDLLEEQIRCHHIITAWPAKKVELMEEFNAQYGDWNAAYWKSKVEENIKPHWFIGDNNVDYYLARPEKNEDNHPTDAWVLNKVTRKPFLKLGLFNKA